MKNEKNNTFRFENNHSTIRLVFTHVLCNEVAFLFSPHNYLCGWKEIVKDFFYARKYVTELNAMVSGLWSANLYIYSMYMRGVNM